jgi:hypothetical protein
MMGDLALLLNENSEFVDVWDSKHLGHQVVAKVLRRNLYHFPCFPQFMDGLQHQMNKSKHESIVPPNLCVLCSANISLQIGHRMWIKMVEMQQIAVITVVRMMSSACGRGSVAARGQRA